jgi:TonB family protein
MKVVRYAGTVSTVVCSMVLCAVMLAAGAESPDASGDADKQTIVVSSHAIREAAVFRQEPEYPAAARQFRLSGEVVAEFTVGLDGKVENVAITKGRPILNDAVIRAVRKWSFSPFMVDGRPHRVKSSLTFNFTL